MEKLENRKGNESKTVEELFDIPDLKDAVFTVDALHCKKTPNKIAESQNHCPVRVKGNQPGLKAAIEDTVIQSEATGCHREEEISRVPLEIRETYLYAREKKLAEGWESIQTIAFVCRYFLSKKKEHKTESFYVTDLRTNDVSYLYDHI